MASADFLEDRGSPKPTELLTGAKSDSPGNFLGSERANLDPENVEPSRRVALVTSWPSLTPDQSNVPADASLLQDTSSTLGPFSLKGLPGLASHSSLSFLHAKATSGRRSLPTLSTTYTARSSESEDQVSESASSSASPNAAADACGSLVGAEPT